MSNGTSLSFLVYMIYNKSIWKYKGEESGYMEKAMEKMTAELQSCLLQKR